MAQVARLPPLPKLRVRRPNKEVQNSCVGVMSQLLGCWASSGYTIEGCGKLEEALRSCMDTKVCMSMCHGSEGGMLTGPGKQKKVQQPKNTINYHLSRFYPKLIGPHKRKR